MFKFLKDAREAGHFARQKSSIDKIKLQYVDLLIELNNLNEDDELSFAVSIHEAHKLFNVLVPDVSIFLQKTHAEKSKILNALTDCVEETAKKESSDFLPKTATLGFRFIHLYCAFLCWGDVKLANQMASTAEPYNRLGWELRREHE